MVADVAALATLTAAGFDIAHAFDAAAAALEPGLAMLAGLARLGLLVGNTRALWPPFQAALACPALAADPDPLERYTERTLDAAFPAARILYSHRRYADSYLPMQRLAVVAGLGAISPSQLVIHPVYGPWFALRAVVLLDSAIDGRGRSPTGSEAKWPSGAIDQACRCTGACEAAFGHAQRSTDWRDWLAVRDACTEQTWRYSDDQIAFHYAGLARLLR